MSDMSETPRTDRAVIEGLGKPLQEAYRIMKSNSIRLEVELVIARADLDNLRRTATERRDADIRVLRSLVKKIWRVYGPVIHLNEAVSDEEADLLARVHKCGAIEIQEGRGVELQP